MTHTGSTTSTVAAPVTKPALDHTLTTTWLADVAAQVNAENASARDYARSAVQCARRAGDLLSQVKRQCRHGEWTLWLKSRRRIQGSALAS